MTENGDLLLGLDAGGTTAKAALFDMTGNLVDMARRPLPTSATRGGGRAERDPNAMWQAVAETIRDLLERGNGTRAARVAAVCQTGYGGGLFAVDATGQTVGPAILSSDRRAIGEAASLNRGAMGAEIFGTLGITLWSAWSLPLLRWIAANGDHTYDKSDKLMWCKDFIRLRLTGQIATDPTDAATAGLLDLESGRYADALIMRTIGRGWRDRLPEIIPGDRIAGHVTEAAAAQTGLLQGTPVVTGAVDLSVCALASGVLESGAISMIAGTWSINQIVTAKETEATRRPLTALPHLAGGLRLISFNSARSAGNLSWVLSQMMTLPGHHGQPGDHGAFDRLADPDLLDAASPSFFPFLLGGPESGRGAFLGLGIEHKLPEIVTAMYEGVAFAHLQDSAPLWTIAPKCGVIRLAGGAAASPTWARIFADCFGRPVETLDCAELGAKGCAIMAAVALGLHPDAATASRAMARLATRIEPDPARHQILSRRYERWQKDAEWLAGRS